MVVGRPEIQDMKIEVIIIEISAHCLAIQYTRVQPRSQRTISALFNP